MLTVEQIRTIVQSHVSLTKSAGDTQKKCTVAETYHVGKLSGNRLNSGTIRSQLIICQDLTTWRDSDDAAKRSIHSDQRVFVQIGDDLWDVYKGQDFSENHHPVLWKEHISGLDQFLANKSNLEFVSDEQATVGGLSLFEDSHMNCDDDTDRHDMLAAIRTKPFVLLAGISGTGKSRMVRELARGCCPDGHELGKDKDGTANAAKKPGNFEMIPVRPNWHDSSELMGYVTRITDDGKPKYVIKPFVKFLVKAAIYKDVPFFLCLDEMNLAPVEQYFAEYLSVVETRKVVKDAATGAVTDIVSDVLVDFDQPEIDIVKTAQDLMADWLDFSFAVGEDEQPTITVVEKVPGAKAVYDQIVADKGVRIPRNFVVMGTVNMDETTCSFSRKVLDRAMTFELNEVDMDEGLAASNEIPYGAIPPSAAFATAVEGFDFYLANQAVCNTLKTYLNAVNAVLDGTPFKFAYRSRNEIMLYCIERMKSGVVELPTALDEATSMKILSRIEGDEDKLAIYKMQGGNKVRESLLDVLIKVIPAALKVANDNNDPNPACEVCAKKLEFMQNRLVGGFTNFFV